MQLKVEAGNRVAETAGFSEGLPVLAGKRTYTISGLLRDAAAFLQVELLGTREAFEIPIAGAVPKGAQFRIGGRRIEAGKSQLDVMIGADKLERHLWVAIEPSQYEADADRPDRVRVFNGTAVLEKDMFPADSKYKLSPTSADVSTVVALPGSGKAKGTDANVVIELAQRAANAPGTAVTLNLQKSGEKKTIAVDSPDLAGGFGRLVKQGPGKPDTHGNPTQEVAFDVLDASGSRKAGIDITLTSWANAGAKDEGYTWLVNSGGGKQTGGFTMPPSSTDFHDFNTRILTSDKAIVETVAGDRGYQVQLLTQGGKGLNLMFHRTSPAARDIMFVLSSQLTGESQTFRIPYAGDAFRPRIVAENSEPRGQAFVGFDGTARDVMVSWDVQDIDGDAPKLDESNGPGHIILARAKASTIQLLVAGNGLPPWQATWRTPLPPEFIMPPRWVRTQIGARVGWLQRDGNRFVPDDQLGPQVQGAEIARIFGEQYAIGYVHSIPAVGELVMVGEAIVGREIITGRRLSTEERALYLAIGAVAAVVGGAGVTAAARAENQAIAREAAALAKSTGMAEVDAEALIRASAKLSKEEQQFLLQARASTQAGKTLAKEDVARAKILLENLEANRASIKASLLKAKGAAPVPAGGALTKDSVVIDANVGIALAKRELGLPLGPIEKALLERLDALGAKEYRIADVAAGEVKTGSVEWAGLDLTAKRSFKEYKQLLEVLDRYNVGNAKGAADRSIVADTFFSKTEPGVVPKFATSDRGIYNSMLRIKGINPAKLGKAAPEAFPSGFDVTINGRTVKVIPLPMKK